MRPRTRPSPVATAALFALLLPVATGCGSADRADIQARLDAAAAAPVTRVREADLEGLPPPLARYLRRAGVVGRPVIRAVRARGTGEILSDGSWLFLEQEFYATLPEPSRDWLAVSGRGDLAMQVAVHDGYARGEGRMSIRMFGDVPFQEQQGPEMTASALVTLLSEFMHVPTAFLDPRVDLEQLGPDTVRAWFEDAGYRVSVTFHFDENGDLVRATSDDRFAATDEGMVPRAWSAECLGWLEVDGLRLCNRFRGLWHQDGEAEEYVHGTYDELQPDLFELY